MKIEFKEKTFEKQFGIEIGRKTNIIFSPDQCDERFLGFDEAFFLPLEYLLSVAPYRRSRRYARMTGVSVREFEHIGEELSRRMPPFRFNIFAQYKRPDYLISRGAKQWRDWGEPYFRYETTLHQQEALAEIETLNRGRAAAIYASPAFRTSDELWQYVEEGEVVQNSNIASVGRLNGHEKYTYISSGQNGKGHSETEEIESVHVFEVLGAGMENEPLPYNQHVKQTAKTITEAVRVNEDSARIFELASMATGLSELEAGTLIWAMATVEVFADAFDVHPMLLG